MEQGYSVFISHRHPETKLKKFDKYLNDKLLMFFEAHGVTKVFLDTEDSAIAKGDEFEKKIAKALCQSTVMIMIYYGNHFVKSGDFFTREYISMKKLIKERKKKVRNGENVPVGTIIPIVVRGWNKLPSEISHKYECVKLEKIRIDYYGVMSKENAEKLEKLASDVSNLLDSFNEYSFNNIIKDCENFKLVPRRGAEVKKFRKEIVQERIMLNQIISNPHE